LGSGLGSGSGSGSLLGLGLGSGLECGSARPRFCLTNLREGKGTKDGSWKEITIVSRRAGAAHSVFKKVGS
jgi:hypothetical protein